MKIITKPRTLILDGIKITNNQLTGELQQHIIFSVFDGNTKTNEIAMQVGDTLSIQHTTDINIWGLILGYLRGGVIMVEGARYEQN